MVPQMPSSETLSPGMVLAGRYRIGRLLNTTILDRRYLAEDSGDGASVTVQEIPGGPFSSIEDREQAASWFDRNAGRLAGLRHTALANIRDHWASSPAAGPFYLVQDYVPGLTLAEELEEADGAVPWRQALDWGIALCEVLAYLHGQGQVCRTIRPHQVVLDSRSGAPVLIEMGLARRLTANAADNWGYVPFEEFIGRAEPRSDLYALGVLLRALLSGIDPDLVLARLRRRDPDLQHALRALFPPLDAAALAIPAGLAAVLARATAFGLNERFPDAAAMAAALRQVRGPEVVSSPGIPEPDDKRAVWVRLGFRREVWFALPMAERNRYLLTLAGEATQSAPAAVPPASRQPRPEATLQRDRPSEQDPDPGHGEPGGRVDP